VREERRKGNKEGGREERRKQGKEGKMRGR
jgi:hypothetical protein